MSQIISRFITQVQNRFANSQSIEHAYRPALQELLESILPDIQAINDGKRTKVGAPDFQIFHKDVPVAYLEAKDMGVDLDKELLNKNQITKYQQLGNLCFTNNLDWVFYHEDREIARISIGKIINGDIIPDTSQYAHLELLIKDFLTRQATTIRSSLQLAKKMALKAQLIKTTVFNTLESEDVSRDLSDQYEAFKEDLIHDLTHSEFSDIYAQTIAYGLFTARFYDPTLPTFSRDEARNLLPKSNPFLRKFFDHVAGIDMESRIVWIIDDLISMFLHVDVVEILKDFGSRTKQTDPILHFYETFLGEYDPAKRKSRGVYYTPQPVVDFIVRSVDEVLKRDFGLPKGLADNSKITTEIPEKDKMDMRNVRAKVLKNGHKRYYTDLHKVQILDPATGTGTFPLAVMKHIAKDFVNMQGIWQSYVKNDLVPRLHGFEIMMSSYSMAHLKLAMYLKDTGVTLEDHQRLDIYLTNSLEEGKDDTHNLFSSWLSNEAKEANYIKNQTPVMVVIGNPPYSVSSSNSGDWITNLVKEFKKDLNERNIQPLSDDYIKFIRFGQHFIEKNGEGILAYISNNSFVDGIIHRQMRKSLLETFDDVYILDLHGNSKKKEVSPDGSADQNVFDIMQGVSINIFVKSGKKSAEELGNVYHADLYGKREVKYDYLDTNSLQSVEWQKLEYTEPNYFFVPKDFSAQVEYEKGVKLDELFNVYGSGVKFRKDNLLVKNSKNEVRSMVKDMRELKTEEILFKHNINETNDWILNNQKENFFEDVDSNTTSLKYRPFDIKYTFYPLERINAIIPRGDSRHNLMKHLLYGNNLALLTTRSYSFASFTSVFISKELVDIHAISDQTYCFPLYLYPENKN